MSIYNEFKEDHLENQCKEVVTKTLQNPRWLTSCLMRFIIFKMKEFRERK